MMRLSVQVETSAVARAVELLRRIADEIEAHPERTAGVVALGYGGAVWMTKAGRGERNG